MNLEPRIRLVPELMVDDIRAWRAVCLECGYRTIPTLEKRADLARRVHRHRHIVGAV